MGKDYYRILGVDRNAGDDEIKSAFRKLAHKYHPDKKGGDERKFKEASEAYAVLSDKKKRAEYDAYGRTFAGGSTGSPQGGPFGGFDFSTFTREGGFEGQEFDLGDIFGEFFGGSSFEGGRRRGRDISIDIELPFKEGVFGTERRVLITKMAECESCSGSGAEKGSASIPCASCNGKGSIRESRSTFFGSFTSTRVCPKCHGKGKIPEKPCSVCRGLGIAKREEEIHVIVPAGISDGEMIRMPGRGEAVVGGSAGDLYVKLHVRTDKNFTREGANLLTTLSIKLTDALLGGDYKIKSLDSDVSITVPAGVSHGELVRAIGRGVPFGRGSRGDLLVRIAIEFPKKLSKRAQELISQLREEGL